MKTVLDENFISSDAGNGWAACYRLVGGKLKSHGIPHARARVTGAKLATDLGGRISPSTPTSWGSATATATASGT